jgi:hemoglobin-like flavoprotein
MITPAQKQIIETTFTQIAAQSDEVAATFYGRLFELFPETRAMFKTDMRTQGRALMQMLAVAVHSLDRMDNLVPAVEALGKRHAGYGVTKEQYAVVGNVLLWTLQQKLGSACTLEVLDAWGAVYTLLADVATAHAYEADPA